MNPAILLIGGVGLVLLGGVASLVFARAPRLGDLTHKMLVLPGLLACAGAGGGVLLGGSPIALSVQPHVPGGPWAILVDPLAGWFLIVLGIAGAAATSYGTSYLAHERAHRQVAWAHAVFALLLAAMVMVVVAHAAVLFLLAWEIMALSAYFLIMFDGDREAVRRAGLIYLVLTHAGTLALIAMFLVWGRGTSGVHLRDIGSGRTRDPLGRRPRAAAGARRVRDEGGRGTHALLAAGRARGGPSHVSAVLSGIMLKMGIYGLLRVLNLLGSPPAWFGWTLFGLGLGSGVLGVLWALGQHDLKRALAYSSVENIGIILLAMGVGVLGMAYGQPVVALLGFIGALLHTLNHALFKSLLFLGAGAVVRATGTREIDRLGGLARRMPLTAVAFGVGSVAIVGLPPLNGFVSEWVVAQGLLRGVQSPMLPALMALGVTGLGLIGGLALVCFTRLGGGVFLGRPRGPEVAVRDEPGLVVPMLALAVLCVVLGAYPAIAVRPAVVVVGTIVAGRTDGIADAGSVVASALPSVGVLGALLAVLVVLTWYLRHRAGRSHEPAIGMTWGCAYARPGSRMQYTASSFSAPVLRAFGAVAAPRVKRDATSLSSRHGRPGPHQGGWSALGASPRRRRAAASAAARADHAIPPVHGAHGGAPPGRAVRRDRAAPVSGLIWGAGFMLAAAACAVLFRRWSTVADRLYAALLVAGCILGVIPAIRVLGGAPAPTAVLAGSLPGGPWSFGLDPLSAWFVLVILRGRGRRRRVRDGLHGTGAGASQHLRGARPVRRTPGGAGRRGDIAGDGAVPGRLGSDGGERVPARDVRE